MICEAERSKVAAIPVARIVTLALGYINDIGEIRGAEIVRVDVNFHDAEISQIVRGTSVILAPRECNVFPAFHAAYPSNSWRHRF